MPLKRRVPEAQGVHRPVPSRVSGDQPRHARELVDRLGGTVHLGAPGRRSPAGRTSSRSSAVASSRSASTSTPTPSEGRRGRDGGGGRYGDARRPYRSTARTRPDGPPSPATGSPPADRRLPRSSSTHPAPPIRTGSLPLLCEPQDTSSRSRTCGTDLSRSRSSSSTASGSRSASPASTTGRRSAAGTRRQTRGPRLPRPVLRRPLRSSRSSRLGVIPYVTSSIIMQILGVVVAKLEELAAGRPSTDEDHRYHPSTSRSLATCRPPASSSSSAAAAARRSSGAIAPNRAPSRTGCPPRRVPGFPTLVARTALLMWIGELISRTASATACSMIIFASVVLGPPYGCGRSSRSTSGPGSGPDRARDPRGGFVFVVLGQRRIPVQFAKQVVGRRVYGGRHVRPA